MTISQLAGSIAPSATLALNEEAQRLRERGEPVINMGVGEPGNPAPAEALRRASERLADGRVKYAPPDGTPSLKRAIIRYTEENYGRLVAPANVIVSAGAKQSLYNVFLSVLDPGDEVILLAPYWVSYPEMVKLARGVPVIVPPQEGTFLPRIEEIDRAAGPRTRALVLNSPNNPSGLVFPDEFVRRVVELCERRGIHLVMDDIYHKLVFDGVRAGSAYAFTSRDTDSAPIVIVNGVSKIYGMTGFRIGWAVASRELVSVMKTIQAQTTSCTSPLLQDAAEGALGGPQETVEMLRAGYESRRDLLLQELRPMSRLRIATPQGAFYCLPDFRAYSPDSVALSRFLLEKAFVVTVPGKEFGVEGHLRLSFAGSEEEIREAALRIRWALDPESPKEIRLGGRRAVRDWT